MLESSYLNPEKIKKQSASAIFHLSMDNESMKETKELAVTQENPLISRTVFFLKQRNILEILQLHMKIWKRGSYI